jgi:aspartate racemase
MKKIGIVGGVGWASTADYYRLICSATNAHFKAAGVSPPYPTPPITIESLNMAETRKLRGQPGGDDAGWVEFDAVFRKAFKRLQSAGCDFGILASNTPHARLHAIKDGLTLPLISIFDTSVDAAKTAGAEKALVLGTSVTMKSKNYPSLLRQAGIEPNARLEDAEIDAFQKTIDTEFYDGATDTGQRAILDLCQRHVKKTEETMVLLACTELPLAFPMFSDDPVFDAEGFRFVNTSAAHARAALNVALNTG